MLIRQDAVIKLHLDKWLADPSCTSEFSEFRDRLRDMNQETSQMARRSVLMLCPPPTSLRAVPQPRSRASGAVR